MILVEFYLHVNGKREDEGVLGVGEDAKISEDGEGLKVLREIDQNIVSQKQEPTEMKSKGGSWKRRSSVKGKSCRRD